MKYKLIENHLILHTTKLYQCAKTAAYCNPMLSFRIETKVLDIFISTCIIQAACRYL